MERLTNCKEITKETDMTQQLGYSHIYKRLAEVEDAIECGDLVEVVRCKDCVHCTDADFEINEFYCEIDDEVKGGLQFYYCGDGERKPPEKAVE